LSPLAGLTSLSLILLNDNRINDMSPLAVNTGLGPASFGQAQDLVDLRANPLSQENLCNDIPSLQSRDVVVLFDGSCAPPGTAFTLLTGVQGAGTIEPAPGARSFAPGTQIAITATADPTSTFDHWEGDFTVPGNPTIVVITDRNDLDQQLFDTFAGSASVCRRMTGLNTLPRSRRRPAGCHGSFRTCLT
jgi:hypothetical protein